MAEWFKAAVLKTASRKGRGFESYPFRHLRCRNQTSGVSCQNEGERARIWWDVIGSQKPRESGISVHQMSEFLPGKNLF